jgi:putative phage-type endonuclease
MSTTNYKRDHILPENKEQWLGLRRVDVTSTEVAALFGASPYKTPFGLWQSKRPNYVEEPFEETARMKWGTRLQDAIAIGVAEDQGWTVRRRNVYSRIPELKLGASFDFEILNHPDGPGLLEIKNVDFLQFRDTWSDEDGVLEAPPHIELQLQTQLLAANRSWGAIVALVAGNEPRIAIRKASEQIHTEIEVAVSAFWASQRAGVSPDPDWLTDSKHLRQLYSQSTPGAVLYNNSDEVDELVNHYKHLSSEIKGLEDLKEATRNQILASIGDAEKVLGNGWSISASTVEAKIIPEYIRASYRGFRVNVKKSK